ncbi:transglycosylase domain-containing protein [Acetatifactor muris]|uniref:transglycosylase domain-containing protein n=1 Tax=Acetatifactor muris TaxID=879566 RepID=UPI0023F2B1C5|nr:transglycosylase domain-containing protein [Acetatifactor muris]
MNYGKRGIRATQKALNSKTKKWTRKFGLSLVKLTLAACAGLVICGIAGGIGAYNGILASTPQIRLSDVVASGEATIVYDCEGNEIDQYVSINSNRIQINSMDLIPKHLGQAFVAIEDKRFYQHNGIDMEGIARSGWNFITSMGKRKEGASTITQQLLKNTIFTTWTEEDGNLIKMIKRKFQEQYLALEISKYYSKDDILLRYMNAINLGQNTLGVESASQRYFGKSCSDLTLSECAVIASITQNPYYLNPIRFPESNAERRLKCLNIMLELDFITDAEYDTAIADTDAVYARIKAHDEDYRVSTNATSGSYFSDAVFEQVRDDLINIAGYSETMAENLLYAGGLRIESTMDPTIQAIADEEFANPENYPENVKWYLNYALTVYAADGEKHNFSKENMMTWFKDNQDKKFNLIFSSQDAAYEAIEMYRAAVMADLGIANEEDNYAETVTMTPQPQAAMAIEDQSTGYVVALVGGRGVKEGRRTLNRATSSTRSPGSTFKVLAAFAPALDSAGQTLATVYNDAPFNYANGTPVKNWYKGYRGINSIREAIRESLNIVAVKTETVITPQLGYDYLINFGFTTLTDGETINGDFFTDINQTVALGGLTHGVTPYELNAAYAAIANMGTYMEPKLYSRVINTDGDVILDNTTPKSKQVIKETTAFLLTDAMVDVVTTGTGAAVNFNRNMAIAGKTGTSTDYWDVWFAGFTPYYTCSVWAGYDNNVSMSRSGGNREDHVARDLWRAIMSRVHENLPNEQFTTPPGIVRAQICPDSGRLPIPGLCAAKSELFAEGTVPTEPCTVHYTGTLCRYDVLPASPGCPFPGEGTLTLPLAEDPSLASGSTTLTTNPDGTVTPVTPGVATSCQHNEEFFANPDYEAILANQAAELMQRDIAAGLYPAPEDWEDDED